MSAIQEQPSQITPQPSNVPGRDYKSIIKSLISRLLFVYFISSMFKRSKDPPISNNTDQSIFCKSSNILNPNENIDLYFFISEFNYLTKSNSKLVWNQNNLLYNNVGLFFNNETTYTTNFSTTTNMQNNGSIYGHFYIVKGNGSPYPDNANHDPLYTFSFIKRLNKFKRKIYKKTQNLITGLTSNIEGKEKIESGTKSEIISHWHPNLTLNIVFDNTSWVLGKIPHPIDQYIEFTENDTCHYKPILYINDFWNLGTDYYPINDTSEYLNISFTFSPISLFKWQLYVSQEVKNKWVSLLTEGVDTTSSEHSDDQDENKDAFKKALIETNPYLLLLTILISIVHSVFEILAFKNDIQFWKSRESLEGISIRSVFFNIITSVIVLLYVMDNETNFMVKMTLFVGMFIEFWKITKCIDITVNREAPKIMGLIPVISFKNKPTYVESDTKKYDKLAFRYLSWMLFPLLFAYSVYSIIYQEHKGWYSFILNILYGFLLTFGFIMMTPQLFINYKLKSVAHLPWRMLTYKALNTFIDDIFAFVIHMPTMYRIGCFRDDIIFFVYLYQRWAYKTDMKRMNEFGISGETISSSQNKQLSITTTPAETAVEASLPTIKNNGALEKAVDKGTPLVADIDESEEPLNALGDSKGNSDSSDVSNLRHRHVINNDDI